MRRATLVRTAAAATSAVLLVAACGSSGTTGSQATFRAGLSGIDNTDVLTVTLNLDTTPDAVIAFAKSQGHTINATTAAAIAGASLVTEIRTTDGTDLSSIKPGSSHGLAAHVTLSDSGQTLAELVAVDNLLYAHADVKSLLAAFNKKPKAYAELQARAATLPPFVKAFVAGKWVSLDITKLFGMLSQFGLSTPDVAQSTALIKAIENVFATDVAVTRVGSDSQGDHLRLTAQSKKLVSDLLSAVMASMPTIGAFLTKLDTKSLPARSIGVDAWVHNGALAKLSLDLMQFAPTSFSSTGGAHMFAVMTFEKSGGSIDKPSGATPVDLTQLLTLLGGLTGLGG